MSGKYEAEVDPSNRNTSHALIIDLVGEDQKVLDVGAATGYVDKHMVQRGCRVTGLEMNPEAARLAERYCERVIVGDIETLDLDRELVEAPFDVIVFGDVLEHLKDPVGTLRRLRPFLQPEGRVVASIPNIAHGSVRLALLQGKFQYRPLGLLDNTHLRFFTRESVEQLFNEAGFLVGDLERVTIGIFDTEVEVDPTVASKEIIDIIRQDPDSETYQFVLNAYLLDGENEEARLENRARLLSEHLASRDRMIYELNRKLRNFEELQRQLTDRDEKIREKKRDVNQLKKRVDELNRQLVRGERQRESRIRRGVEQ